MNTAEKWHGTTIVLLRKNGETVVAGDGQVSLGNTVLKSKAKKVRKIESRGVIAGFAGSTADALTLFERLEAKLEKHAGNLQRAAVEFFESHAQEEVYFVNYGYKSYVPWFYGEVQPYVDPKAYKREWLYHGQVDRDVLIATKVNKVGQMIREIPDAQLLYHKNGFYFYRRKAYAR